MCTSFYPRGRNLRELCARIISIHRLARRYRVNPSVTAAPCHRSTVRHSQSAPSHRAAFSGPVFRGCALRFAPCARHFSPSGLRTLASSLVALPASLESSYRPALRWPGIPGLRSASRCPRPFTPSGLRRQRPVSRTARGLRAPRRRRPSVPALRTALAFGGAVFRRCGRPLGVSSRLQPLRGLRLRTSCARHFSPSGLRCSQAHSRLSLPYWAYFALLRALRALRAPLSRLAPTAPLCERGAFWKVAHHRK